MGNCLVRVATKSSCYILVLKNMFRDTLSSEGLQLGENGPTALSVKPVELMRRLLSRLDSEASTKDFLGELFIL